MKHTENKFLELIVVNSGQYVVSIGRPLKAKYGMWPLVLDVVNSCVNSRIML